MSVGWVGKVGRGRESGGWEEGGLQESGGRGEVGGEGGEERHEGFEVGG